MSYRVELPVFCGPLDLLLHLVRQQEVDIHEVRIAAILDQYLGYLKVLEALDLADLGEFLVLASTLMEIKSREMLPREEVDVEEGLDPRDDLIRRLLEYKRYRDVSRRLARLAALRQRMITAAVEPPAGLEETADDDDGSLDLGDIEIWTLTAAFARLLEETGREATPLAIGVDKRDIRYYAARVLERVRSGAETGFSDLFDTREGRYGLIGAFIAVLEMVKQGALRVWQAPDDGRIVVVYRGPTDATVDQILTADDRIDAVAGSAADAGG